MFQKKGEEPVITLPSFKLLVPYDETACIIIAELLTELGTRVTEPIDPKKVEKAVYVTHRNGEIGYGTGISAFINAPVPELSFTELTQWKIVPIQATLAEIEEMVGHKLEIIEKEKEE